MSAGYVYCAQCHAERSLVLEMSPDRVATIVREFTAAHTHGPVVVVTPGPARETKRSKHSRRGEWVDAPRTIPCAWCSKPATGLDRKDPVCTECAGRAA